MKKKALNKDIRKSFSKSKGRFISIACLIALGSFALVGLQVTGPDMRKTSSDYLQKYNAADLTVIGSMEIDSGNVSAINSLQGVSEIEYGYLKDVVLEGTFESCRIFSLGNNISEYELVGGRLPENANEIAYSDASKGNYKLGDTIVFEEKEDSSGNTVLKNNTFTIVGFINSSEILSCVNQGQSTAGSGELNSYGVVTDDAFDCNYYMIARITFQDTKGLDPYSDEYTDMIQEHKSQLEAILADQSEKRLESVKGEYQDKIDEGRQKISDAQNELADAETKLNDADAQIQEAEQKILESRDELDSKVIEAQQEIEANPQAQLASSQEQISQAETQLSNAKAQLSAKQNEYNAKAAKLQSGETQLSSGKSELESAKNELASQQADGEAKISEAEETLSEKKQEYQEKLSEYNKKKPDADTEIADNTAKLDDAQKEIDKLSLPTFSVYSRREIPGAEGYKTYSSVSDIVDALADVFPIFMYFVAALVTLTTMTRFVDEERINSVTLKALGYQERDIIKKFTLYGLISGLICAATGFTSIS